MSIASLRTIFEEGDVIVILDQNLLPHRRVHRRLATLQDAARAIRDMQVRGAPLIGVTAAWGVALAIAEVAGDEALESACAMLGATRPTAINLNWALARMKARLMPLPEPARRAAAWAEARAITAQDIAANRAIGRHGLALIERLASTKRRPVNVMTHCNAGALATAGWGTALAPVHAAKQAGIDVHVFVSETRPRNQGLLSAWELREAGIPHTLIVDNAAGHLMRRGEVDLVLVGADRIAANGDAANKIGTYLKALAAKDNGIPFHVAAPASTIDWNCASGADIPIEERAGAEVRSVSGLDAHGAIVRVDLVTGETRVANPAFDVTPARLVTGIVCERGIAAPQALLGLFPERA